MGTWRGSTSLCRTDRLVYGGCRRKGRFREAASAASQAPASSTEAEPTLFATLPVIELRRSKLAER
jgi:hypothetical protein